jgi:hypothetical protein
LGADAALLFLICAVDRGAVGGFIYRSLSPETRLYALQMIQQGLTASRAGCPFMRACADIVGPISLAVAFVEMDGRRDRAPGRNTQDANTLKITVPRCQADAFSNSSLGEVP